MAPQYTPKTRRVRVNPIPNVAGCSHARDCWTDRWFYVVAVAGSNLGLANRPHDAPVVFVAHTRCTEGCA